MMARSPMAERPLQAVRRLCSQGASGELIVVADDAEVHVYLQSGRLAWATSSRAPLVFSRELIAQADIDQESFRTLLDDCRKSRRPLGETLLSWGLASEEQVRSALESQLRDALQTLATGPGGSTLFLERTQAFAHYDRRFTFDGFELLDDLEQEGVRTLERPEAPESVDACRDVLERVPGAIWSSLKLPGKPAYTVGNDDPVSLPEAAWQSLERGVEIAIVRAGRGTAVGCASGIDGNPLWVGLDAEVGLGAALSALAMCLGRTTSAPSRPSAMTAPVETTHASLCPECDGALRQLLSGTRELQAVGVCEGGQPLHVVERRGLDASAVLAHDLEHAPLLELGRSPAFQPRPGDLESYGFHFGTLALCVEASWHFLSEVTDGSGRLTWLWIDGLASQGLGWAMTSSVNRLLASQHGCHPRDAHG